MDASRWLLNTLLAHKVRLGLGRRDEHPAATHADIDAVLDKLEDLANALEAADRRATAHLRGQIRPLVAAYAAALQKAGYPPSLFFSCRFTIDTGQIVNLVEELDPRHLSPVVRATGRRLRSHTIALPGDVIEHIGLEQGRAGFALPGLTA
ncbi:hypothetical protein [Streptomyces sp. UNOC14_S4]|uniref:hypothetical protein n=1 Tax=Streptomyces sp. UNOC14_S4 TaxID=2872340 RepID=UPI001E49C532|nr:hypothetical protein [Streptomyces sp. UNOC14_S4]MCC3771040.1 hypothetical protein [Streptomyces sp. UNOC14_S4]